MNFRKILYSAAALSFCATSITFAATPSIKVTAVPPTGSAGKAYDRKIVPSMPYTPCLSQAEIPKIFDSGLSVENHFDQFTFSITGKNSDITDPADGTLDYDLYFFFVNFGGSGTGFPDAQIYAVSRYDPFTSTRTGVHIELSANASSINATTGMLLKSGDFSADAISEIIFGGTIRMDGFGLQQGTWMAVSILADNTTVDFTDASTWVAWDAVPFILGLPWPAAGATCD